MFYYQVLWNIREWKVSHQSLEEYSSLMKGGGLHAKKAVFSPLALLWARWWEKSPGSLG